ncbi:hypothetical protein NTCA1_52980 [Novosphingobium sp. TCA1]|nr:hypothetical protein NTCA1_52980 [Novosphingobium sp. TCA1]
MHEKQMRVSAARFWMGGAPHREIAAALELNVGQVFRKAKSAIENLRMPMCELIRSIVKHALATPHEPNG